MSEESSAYAALRMAAQHEHRTVNPHSVELTLTAAGKVSGSVKVYDEDEGRAFERAAAIMDRIRKGYPGGA